METVIFLLVCALVLRGLATAPARLRVTGSWWHVARAWGADVVEGARNLSRLDAVRHERLGGRHWS